MQSRFISSALFGDPMPQALLIADAGPGIGQGHVARTTAIGHALLDSGWHAEAWTTRSGRSCMQAAGIDVSGYLDEHTSGHIDLSNVVASQQFAAIIIDSYRHHPGNLAKPLHVEGASTDRPLIATFSDDGTAPTFPSDIVIAAGSPTMPSQPYNTTWLTGLSYCVLGPEYEKPPRGILTSDAVRVVIGMGATDGKNLTADLTSFLASRLTEVEFRVIVGPFMATAQKRRLYSLAEANAKVDLIEDPPIVADILERADIAIVAAGQMMLESMASCLPTIAVVTAPNQTRQAKLAEQAGVFVCDGTQPAQAMENVAKAMQTLVHDPTERRTRGARARRAVDGRGAPRVAEHIRVHVAEKIPSSMEPSTIEVRNRDPLEKR